MKSLLITFLIASINILHAQTTPDLKNVSIKLTDGTRLTGRVEDNYQDQLLFKSNSDTFYMIKKSAIDTINLRVMVNGQFMMADGNTSQNFFKNTPVIEYKSSGSYISSGASTQIVGIFIGILGAGVISIGASSENLENGKTVIYLGTGLSVVGAICQIAGIVKIQKGGEMLMGEMNKIGY
ncbi:MAG: hypothetical protein IPO24_06645 [Bacteroidetes bacterium]|nr:hypothetical protein [Bacteroidota bacterium]